MIYELHVESLPGHQYYTSHTFNLSEHFLFVFIYSSKAWRLCQPNFNAFNNELFELFCWYGTSSENFVLNVDRRGNIFWGNNWLEITVKRIIATEKNGQFSSTLQPNKCNITHLILLICRGSPVCCSHYHLKNGTCKGETAILFLPWFITFSE